MPSPAAGTSTTLGDPERRGGTEQDKLFPAALRRPTRLTVGLRIFWIVQRHIAQLGAVAGSGIAVLPGPYSVDRRLRSSLVVEFPILSVSLGADRRRRVARFGGPVTKLCRPVSFICRGDQFGQPLGAVFQVGAQLLLGGLSLGRRIVAGSGGAFPLLGRGFARVDSVLSLDQQRLAGIQQGIPGVHQGIPTLLLSVVTPSETFSAGMFIHDLSRIAAQSLRS